MFFKFQLTVVGSQFVGILAIALASIAVVSRPRSWLVVALAFIAVYSLLSSTGIHLSLAYLNYIIPLLNKIREPSRFLVLFQLAVGVLAAFGIDELRKTVLRAETAGKAKRQLMALAVIAVIAVLTLAAVPERIESQLPPVIALVIFVALIFMTWMVTHTEFRGRDTIIAAVWSGATLTLLAIEVPWMPRAVSSSTYLTSGAVALDMAIARVATLDPNRDYRVLFDGKINKQVAAMLASYRGVRTLSSYFNPGRYRQFKELYYHGPRAGNYFRILGAKYLICQECSAKSLRGYQYLESIAGYEIYATQDVLPRSYIVQRVNGEFLNLTDFKTKAASVDLTKKLLFIEPHTEVELPEISDTAEEDCLSREDMRLVNRSRFVVQCKSSGVLVLNEFFDDAWRSTVDGVKVRTLRVNGNQMGVPFTPGSHVIELRYLPINFLVSLGAMFVGVLSLICLLVACGATEVTDEQPNNVSSTEMG